MEQIDDVYKFICEKCNFKCMYKSAYDAHLKSGLHQTGHRKKRCDSNGPYNCDKCNYTTTNKTTFKKHTLNEHANKQTREKEFRYYCKHCDFGTFSNDSMNAHNNTKKHIKNIKAKLKNYYNIFVIYYNICHNIIRKTIK